MEQQLIKANIKDFPDKILEKETIESLGLLEKINKLGFITSDSQDGLITKGMVPNDITDYVSKKSKLSKKYLVPLWEKDFKSEQDAKEAYDDGHIKIENAMKKQYKKGFHKDILHSQRSYLSGFMTKELAYVFNYLLNLETDKICITSESERIPVTYEVGYSPSDSKYPFGKFYQLHKKYLNGDVFPGTNFGFFRDKSDDKYMFNYLENLIKSKKDFSRYFVFVNCVDPTHGRKSLSENGLFKDIEKILKKSQRIIA